MTEQKRLRSADERKGWRNMALLWAVMAVPWALILWPNAVVSLLVALYSYHRFRLLNGEEGR